MSSEYLSGWSCWCRCGPLAHGWILLWVAELRCPLLAPGDHSSACRQREDHLGEAAGPPGRRGTEWGGHPTWLCLEEEQGKLPDDWHFSFHFVSISAGGSGSWWHGNLFYLTNCDLGWSGVVLQWCEVPPLTTEDLCTLSRLLNTKMQGVPQHLASSGNVIHSHK